MEFLLVVLLMPVGLLYMVWLALASETKAGDVARKGASDALRKWFQ